MIRNVENWIHYYACMYCNKIFSENARDIKIWRDCAFCCQECEDKYYSLDKTGKQCYNLITFKQEKKHVQKRRVHAGRER